MNTACESKRVQTLVIGGGQAGLSVGYYLAKRGMSFLIIDANQRIWHDGAASPCAAAVLAGHRDVPVT